MTFLGMQAERRDRPCLQPPQIDRLVRFHAVAITAIVDPTQCGLISQQFAFAVASKDRSRRCLDLRAVHLTGRQVLLRQIGDGLGGLGNQLGTPAFQLFMERRSCMGFMNLRLLDDILKEGSRRRHTSGGNVG